MFRPVSAAILLALLHTAPTVHAQSMLVDAPAGLSAEVYSSSAVEIFWLRTQGAVLYTVTRDGEQLVQVDTGTFTSFIAINALPSDRGGNTFFEWSRFSESLPLFNPEF